MKLERPHKVVIILAVVAAAIVGIVILLLPNRHVTGASSTNSASNTLPVVQSDGGSVGQSINGNDLVPAPATSGLQQPDNSSRLQPTGSIQ